MISVLADLAPPQSPVAGPVGALAATVLIEVPLTLLLVPRLLPGVAVPLGRLAVVAALANFVTQPLVWAGAEALGPGTVPLLELGAIAAEGLLLAGLLKLPIPPLLGIAALTNLTSWGLGLLLQRG
ncbi:MAG TPA: hypothetical protein VEI97_04365 [bacterium]|nr:hypothetical protein [bacterium]